MVFLTVEGLIFLGVVILAFIFYLFYRAGRSRGKLEGRLKELEEQSKTSEKERD